jgi:cytidyltransferase-like protein
MKEKIKSYAQICTISHHHKAQGKKVVLCHGVFDILHMGHINFLAKSKKQADVLVVGIDPDRNVKVLKGNSRPIIPGRERLFLISCLEFVDYAFLLPEFAGSTIGSYYPDLYKSLMPWGVSTNKKADQYFASKTKDAKQCGIKILYIDSHYSRHSTGIIQKISKRI